MVEQRIFCFGESQKAIHIETLEIPEAGSGRFFLNEDLAVIVLCNAADSAGRVEIEGDVSHVLDIGICGEDPSTGDLVARPALIDPTKPIPFMDDDVLRIRYKFEEKIEEARFIHKKPDSNLHSCKKVVTTPRMRKIIQR